MEIEANQGSGNTPGELWFILLYTFQWKVVANQGSGNTPGELWFMVHI